MPRAAKDSTLGAHEGQSGTTPPEPSSPIDYQGDSGRRADPRADDVQEGTSQFAEAALQEGGAVAYLDRSDLKKVIEVAWNTLLPEPQCKMDRLIKTAVGDIYEEGHTRRRDKYKKEIYKLLCRVKLEIADFPPSSDESDSE